MALNVLERAVFSTLMYPARAEILRGQTSRPYFTCFCVRAQRREGGSEVGWPGALGGFCAHYKVKHHFSAKFGLKSICINQKWKSDFLSFLAARGDFTQPKAYSLRLAFHVQCRVVVARRLGKLNLSAALAAVQCGCGSVEGRRGLAVISP